MGIADHAASIAVGLLTKATKATRRNRGGGAPEGILPHARVRPELRQARLPSTVLVFLSGGVRPCLPFHGCFSPRIERLSRARGWRRAGLAGAGGRAGAGPAVESRRTAEASRRGARLWPGPRRPRLWCAGRGEQEQGKKEEQGHPMRNPYQAPSGAISSWIPMEFEFLRGFQWNSSSKPNQKRR